MQVPQFGIFAQGTIAHEFIEFDLRPDVEMTVATAALSRLRAPAVSAGGVNLVGGFGSDLWRAIAPEHAPEQLRPFTPISAVGGHRAPATQHDFWLWINGSSRDVVFEHSRAAVQALADVAVMATDQPAFVHRDSRDLIGFIDGTANPMTHEAPEVALVPEGQPGAGGSHVLVMRWVHDLDGFARLPTAEQELVVGRTGPPAGSWPTTRSRRTHTSPESRSPTMRARSDRSIAAACRMARSPRPGSTSSRSRPIAPASTGCCPACSAWRTASTTA